MPGNYPQSYARPVHAESLLFTAPAPVCPRAYYWCALRDFSVASGYSLS